MFSLFPSGSLAQNTEDPLVKRPRSDSLLKEESDGYGPQAGEGLGGVGVPYSRVMRDVEPPYENIFRNFKLEGEIDTKMGSAAADFHADFFRGVRLNTPFSRGIRPESAEFKLGNFYIDVVSIEGTLLFSDNINLSEQNREADFLMSLRMDLAAMYQFGDTFRVTLRGAVIYLPLSNEIGVAGFGVDDLFGEFNLAPLAEARVAYNLHLSHWEVELIDDFVVGHRRYAEGIDFEIFDGATFEAQEQAGRYRLASSTRTTRATSRNRRHDRLDTSLIEARNRAGVIVTRMLPTETRFEAGGFHENRFYFNRGNLPLPNERDYVFVNLINEREDMRFKPFFHYDASRYDTRPDWTHQVKGGIRGPITDYLEMLAEVGQYWSSFGQSRHLWRFRLEHNPTESIYYYVQYRRTITEPDEDLDEEWSFRLRHKINANLRSEIVVLKSHFEDLDGNLSGSDELRAGIRFTYEELSPGLRAQLGQVFSRIENDNPAVGDFDIWTTELNLRYRHTESVDSRFIYRFKIFDSNLPGDSFYENLILYTLTKYF